ncbi:MAG: chromate transporter [Dysgonamonadaceae bacterium]|jgi:chromate transporter|nr:chromate transporter [Dysgonamonadaceae bacterium]
MVYWKLFLAYLKIGLFNFGGGYAMIPLIYDETVAKQQWLKPQEFTDVVALSQMTPGPIGINSATYVGYVVTGNILGAATATLAICLPAFAIILCIAGTYAKFHQNPYLSGAITGIKTILPGLIAAVTLQMMNSENFIGQRSIIIFILAFILVKSHKLNPIIIILSAAIAGIIIY